MTIDSTTSTALRITDATMQTVIKMCRMVVPLEACGFVVADRDDPTLGVRVVWMKNVHLNPERHYLMDDADVLLAYGEFDQNGEEVIAVFHSHPTSEPIMSATDLLRAADVSLAYLIISFANGGPSARAYRVQHYVGNTIPTEVPIQVQRDVRLEIAALPTAPWALLAGNYVRIAYQRQGKGPAMALTTTVASIVSCDDTDVYLDPDMKTAARSLPLERIRSVHVLREGRLAAGVRQQLRAYAGEVRTLLAGSDTMALPSLVAALAQAYPVSIAITMDGQT